MTTDREEVKRIMAEEKKAEETAKNAEADRTTIAESIKGIGARLDKVEDFCSKFPDLCTKVDRLEEAMPKKVEAGSEEGKAERKSDIEHILLDDCPNCGPLREEVLSAKGKRLADVEAKVEEEDAKVDTKVEEEAGAETKVGEKPKLRTSPGPFEGAKWDEEKGMYVEQR